MNSRKDLFLRNTALNLTGFSLPLALAFLVMPVISHHLGAARFGLLGLAWALLEYFSLLDVGLGRATTKFVAERVHEGSPELVQIITVSVLSQGVTGVAAGAILAAMSPLLVGHALQIPPALDAEARRVLLLLAATVPFVLLSLSLRGVLEAAQRFDISNMIRIPSSAATFLIPAVAAARGLSLPTIVLLLFLGRIITCIALIIAVPAALPGLSWRLPRQWHFLRELLSFGGWVAISNAVSPLLIYLDRFMLGAAAGVAAVGYYTAPYEATTRLLIIPASVVTTLFPLVSAMGSRGEHAALSRMFAASVRNLVLALAVPAAAILVFAPELLAWWLGPDFANQSALAMRILAIGLVVNGLAHVPYSYIQGLGRPDLPAKFHVLELIVYPPIAWVMVRHFGIAGAAASWTIRVLADSLLLFGAACRIIRLSPRQILGQRGDRLLVAVAALAVVLVTAHVLPITGALLLAAGALVLFGMAAWRYVLDFDERQIVERFVSRVVPIGSAR